MIRPDRIGRIGASQVAAVLDLNPFASPAEVQKDIQTGAWEPTPREPGLPARMGHIFESGMLVALEDYLQHEDGLGAPDAQVFPWEPCCLTCGRVATVSEVGAVCSATCSGVISDSIVSQDASWAMATPDGRVEIGGKLALAECKAPFRGRVGSGMFQWGDPEDSRPLVLTSSMSKREVLIERLRQFPIPVYYGAQAQWQLGIARSRGLDFRFNFLTALGLPYRPLSVYTIEFDPYLFELLFELAQAWYDRHITGGEPAAIRTKQEALALFPAEKPGAEKVLSAEQYAVVLEWQRRKILASVLTHAKDGPGSVGELEARVLQFIGDAESVRAPDGTLIGRFPSQATGGRLDGQAVKKLYPDIYQQFYRPGGTTRVWRPNADWKREQELELARAGVVQIDE